MNHQSRNLNTKAAFTLHKSFAEISQHYDGFILDQFGVMHNGRESLPGAVECIEDLSSKGKKLIILSNTSSPAAVALSKLPKMGFEKELFEGAVTSGEEASKYIRKTYGNNSDDQETKTALWFTWDQSTPYLDKCGDIEASHDIDKVDFILAHGSNVVRSTIETETGSNGSGSMKSLGSFMEDGDFTEIDPILKKCKERNLPLICANPDFIVKMADDKIGHMPGKIAKRYESMGGKCKYFGKPYVEHFEACLQVLGLEADRVAHVGDSLHHDIAGANAAGIASVFITSGIHAEDLEVPFGVLPEESVLESFFEAEGITSTYVLPAFKF